MLKNINICFKWVVKNENKLIKYRVLIINEELERSLYFEKEKEKKKKTIVDLVIIQKYL
jgi:hypothetical protein